MESAAASLDEILLDDVSGGAGSSKYVKGLFQACLQGAKASNVIPTEDEDFAFRASTSAEFQKAMDAGGERLRRLLHAVVGRALPAYEVNFAEGDADAIANADSAAFEALTDAVDVLTEKVDHFIDEQPTDGGAAGEGSNRQRSLGRGKLVVGGGGGGGGGGGADAASRKPQELFADGQPASGRLDRFVPRLSCKPHASQLALAHSLRPSEQPQPEPEAAGGAAAAAAEDDDGDDEDEPGARAPPSFGHPYAAEVRALEDGGLEPWMLAPNEQSPLPPPLPAAEARPLPLSGVLAPKAGEPGWAVVLVDTAPKFEEMLAHLLEKEEDGDTPLRRELAVDLEAHSHRAFQSFTCLLQLSTRERDFLVDVIALRQLRHPASVAEAAAAAERAEAAAAAAGGGGTRAAAAAPAAAGAASAALAAAEEQAAAARAEAGAAPGSRSSMLERLNEVLADPRVVKVLHGADSDVLWLQRDCGLYLVNMFDTGQAARAMAYPGFGLAYLLKLHCGQTADKSLQLADWRVRPLTQQLVRYAAMDTHYLLHVYDVMKNELLAGGPEKAAAAAAAAAAGKKKRGGGSGGRGGSDAMLREVLRRSNALTLARAEVPRYRGFATVARLLERQRAPAAPHVVGVLRAVCGWRDAVARAEDESVEFALPTRLLLRLARGGPANTDGAAAPRTVSELQRCLQPLPPLVRARQHELVERIAAAATSGNKAASGAGRLAPSSSSSSSSSPTSTSSAARAPAAAAQTPTRMHLLASNGAVLRGGIPFAQPDTADGAAVAAALRGRAGVLGVEELYAAAGWAAGGGEEECPGAGSGEAAPGYAGLLELLSAANIGPTGARQHGASGGGALQLAARASEGGGAEGDESAGDAAAEAIRRSFEPHALLLQPLLQRALLLDADGAGAAAGAAAKRGPGLLDEGAGEDAGEGDDGIPQSIAAVYGLANRHKRQRQHNQHNVIAGGMAQHAAGGAAAEPKPDIGQYEGARAAGGGGGGGGGGGAAARSATTEFLGELGWQAAAGGGDGAAATAAPEEGSSRRQKRRPQVPAAAASASAAAAAAAAAPAAAFTPFDYGSASSVAAIASTHESVLSAGERTKLRGDTNLNTGAGRSDFAAGTVGSTAPTLSTEHMSIVKDRHDTHAAAIPCRNEENGGTCTRAGCVFLHRAKAAGKAAGKAVGKAAGAAAGGSKKKGKAAYVTVGGHKRESKLQTARQPAQAWPSQKK